MQRRKMQQVGFGLGLVLAMVGGREMTAHAQYPGETVVYETVRPATRTVTPADRYLIKNKPFKTVIRRRPAAIVSTTPPVVRETRYVQPAPIIERQYVQPAPVLESRYVQPAPVLERRWVQPAPVLETRTYQSDPVIQTRYLTPY